MLIKLFKTIIKILVPKRSRKYIRENRIFWKYKDLFNPFYKGDFINNILPNWENERRESYSKYIENNNITTVFEFGCAPGLTLLNILKRSNHTRVYGHDINHSHMSYAIDLFANEFQGRHLFYKILKVSTLERDLSITKLDSFDLAIFDRVLMYLTNVEIEDHFKQYGHLYKRILIDDFFGDIQGDYKHRDFNKILTRYGFKVHETSPSLYSKINMNNNNPIKTIYLKV